MSFRAFISRFSRQNQLMKQLLLFPVYLLLTICTAQNKHEGVLLDRVTKKPLEFVSVYNSEDHTVSNEDGRYAFSSNKENVLFYRTGYEKLETTFPQLKDTVFLDKSVLELNEVVVTNGKSLYQKIKDSINRNYMLEPYKEKFLLRALAKKGDEIWRIQDLQGKLQRKTLFYTQEMERSKKDYEIELTNMRKLGAVTDENNAYLKFPTFSQIFTGFVTMNIEESEFEMTESYFDNGQKIKLEFKSFPSETIRNTSGYYIIDAKTFAIETFHLKAEPKNPPFKKNKFLRYRDIFYEKYVYFKKHPSNNSYFINSAKSVFKVETTDEERSFNVVYELASILTTSNNFGTFQVKKNTNSSKDLFKINYPYNATYWNTQNQLLLTDEMQDFIKRMGSKNKEFKVRSNMD